METFRSVWESWSNYASKSSDDQEKILFTSLKNRRRNMFRTYSRTPGIESLDKEDELMKLEEKKFSLLQQKR
jgi:hypothetical protein